MFSALLRNDRVNPVLTLMVVQWNTPLEGMSKTVLFVMSSAPYEPSLPELKVCATAECPARMPATSRRFVMCFVFIVL